jgi:phage protein D/phage baseplate assembly protein gpV
MTIAPGCPPEAGIVVVPSVYVGPTRRLLAEELADSVVRVVVDVSLRLPGMFEIEFVDGMTTARLLAELAIGTEVGIAAASPLRLGDPRMLITGEVTALEAEYGEVAVFTARGYTEDHRLQRERHTRTFVTMTDADIARKIAQSNGLQIGEITPSRAVHAHVGQVNQTDWEFLSGRAAAIGYEVRVSQGKFFFRQRASGAPVTLMMLDNLVSFSPRVTAGNLAPEAEVRGWDPLAAKVISERVEVTSADTVVGAGLQATLAGVRGRPDVRPPAGSSQYGQTGPPPSERATVVSDQPVPSGVNGGPAIKARAQSLAGRLAATFAEAVGESIGDPWLSAGRAVEVSGVAAPFAGRWMLTRARHVLELGRYRTGFEVSGHQDRTLLGLVRSPQPAAGRTHGVICGLVSNINDPLGKGRVKVVLPSLSPEYESDWASVVQPGAGQLSGAMFLPEPGDEVMVSFEFGDLQRPFVLGGIVNNRSTYTLGAEPVRVNGSTGAVQWRGLVAPSGSRLAFHDEVAGVRDVRQAEILLGSGDGNLTLRIDQVAGTVGLKCVPGQATRPGAKGRLVIECGPGGAIDIIAGSGGEVSIDGGAMLNLKAQRLNLEGAQITVNGSGPVEIKGKPIKLN